MPRLSCLSAVLLLATCCPAARGSVEVPRRTAAAAKTARPPAAKRPAPGRAPHGDQAARGGPGSGVDGRDAPEGATAARPVGVPDGYAEGDGGGGGVGVARRAEVQVGYRSLVWLCGVWLMFGPRELCVAASLKSQLPSVVAAAASERRCAQLCVASPQSLGYAAVPGC